MKFWFAAGTRQEELYRSRGVIVNQGGDEIGAAHGDQLPLRPVGTAMRRMVELREVYARDVNRSGAEDFDARGVYFIILRGGNKQRRAIDLIEIALELSRKTTEIDELSRGESAVHLRVEVVSPGGFAAAALRICHHGDDRAERARRTQIPLHLDRCADQRESI